MMVINTKESGKMINVMDMGCIFVRMVHAMKEMYIFDVTDQVEK